MEAMSSKVILMMPKNQELNKVSSKDSRIKIQEKSRSRFKTQYSRIKRSTNFFFKTLSSTWSFHKIFYQRVLLSGNRLPVASIVFQTDL